MVILVDSFGAMLVVVIPDFGENIFGAILSDVEIGELK